MIGYSSDLAMRQLPVLVARRGGRSLAIRGCWRGRHSGRRDGTNDGDGCRGCCTELGGLREGSLGMLLRELGGSGLCLKLHGLLLGDGLLLLLLLLLLGCPCNCILRRAEHRRWLLLLLLRMLLLRLLHCELLLL